MEQQDEQLFGADPQRVVEALADRCSSPAQFERLLAFVVAGDRIPYKRSTWYERHAELRELGLELRDAA